MDNCRSIAVVGAGAAGLCAAHHLAQSCFTPVVYEASNHIGGTWHYTNEIDENINRFTILPSMYKNLRCNIPKQAMEFQDFPFKSTLPSYVYSDDVLEYLNDYAIHFNILQYIKFNTFVEEISVLTGEENKQFPKWIVKTFCLTSGKYQENIFNGIVICNGHYSVPNNPNIKGIENFKGRILHSHHYRVPDQFVHDVVVILGCGPSGIDISIHLSKTAKAVYLSHRHKTISAVLPKNVFMESVINCVTADSVIFEGGKTIKCNSIIFCTGYKFSFPFFKDETIIQCTDNCVTPLYKHVLHIKYPNLSFIGLCKIIPPFQLFHCQVLMAVSVLEGHDILPSEKKMLEEENEEYKKNPKKFSSGNAHTLGKDTFPYVLELFRLCGRGNISINCRMIFLISMNRFGNSPLVFKGDEFKMTDKGFYDWYPKKKT